MHTTFESATTEVCGERLLIRWLTLLACSCVSLTTAHADGDEYFVPDDFATIQEALVVALDGDTVTVQPGTYKGTVNIRRDVYLRSSDGPEVTTLDGMDQVNLVDVGGTESPAVVEGFTFVRGFSSYSGAAIGANSPVLIRRNVFRDNVAYDPGPPWSFENGEGGAIAVGAEQVTIEENTFENNRAGLSGGAIEVSTGLFPEEPVIVRNNLFVGNSAPIGAAISIPSGWVIVEHNTVVDPPNDGGGDVSASIEFAATESAVEVTKNIVMSTAYNSVSCGLSFPTRGVSSTVGGSYTVSCNALNLDVFCDDPALEDNFVLDVEFCDAVGGDYRLPITSPIHPDSTSCGQIGAFGVGCAPVPIDAETTAAGVGPAEPLLVLLESPFAASLDVKIAVGGYEEQVAIDVFNATGRHVRVLTNEAMGAGVHLFSWNGRDTAGARCASGVYYVRLQSGDLTVTRSAVLIR